MNILLRRTFNRSRHQSFRVVFIQMALLLSAVIFSTESFASSCCAGSGGQTICVLPSEQNFQMGVTTSYRIVEGEFDAYGNYAKNNDSTFSRQVTTIVGGAYRLGEDWQMGLSVPVISNQLTLRNNSKSATAMGDPTLEARYTLWEDLAFLMFRPSLHFYGGVRVPLGKSIYESRDPLALDAVGDGTPSIHVGFSASKFFRPIKLSVDGAYFFPFAKTVDRMRSAPVLSPYRFRAGDRFQWVQSASYLFNEHWSGALGVRQLWVLQSSKGGSPVESSAQRLFSSLVNLNYFPRAEWSLAFNYETAFPFYDYLANQSNAQSVSFAMTYGGF